MPSESLTIFTDGGARGNPGPAASAFVVLDSGGHILAEQGNFIGLTTNNVAEYRGLIFALDWLADYSLTYPINHLTFKLDSLLVVNQLNGLYKVKEPTLRTLYQSTCSSLVKLKIPYLIAHVPRSQNSRADFFVNQTLDSQ